MSFTQPQNTLDFMQLYFCTFVFETPKNQSWFLIVKWFMSFSRNQERPTVQVMKAQYESVITASEALISAIEVKQ